MEKRRIMTSFLERPFLEMYGCRYMGRLAAVVE